MFDQLVDGWGSELYCSPDPFQVKQCGGKAGRCAKREERLEDRYRG